MYVAVSGQVKIRKFVLSQRERGDYILKFRRYYRCLKEKRQAKQTVQSTALVIKAGASVRSDTEGENRVCVCMCVCGGGVQGPWGMVTKYQPTPSHRTARSKYYTVLSCVASKCIHGWRFSTGECRMAGVVVATSTLPVPHQYLVLVVIAGHTNNTAD